LECRGEEDYFCFDFYGELREGDDEPRYCNKNVSNHRATSFTYQCGVHTNLEVTVLYAQVKVKVLPIVTAHLAGNSKGSKPDFYKVRRSLTL